MSTYSFEKTLSKGTQFSLDETPIENGKVRVTTDTKRLFFDLDDKRFEITDFISDYSESYILNNISNPMPKIYLSNDTFKLFKWNKRNNRWDKICDNVEHATSADIAIKATQDGSGNNIANTYAPKSSPAFTGNPTAPKASGTDINSITNVDYVTNYVSDQLASLKNGMVIIVNRYSDLPTVGESGKIYLVPSSSGSGKNRYDEYIWSTTLNDYEKFGTTEIDLEGYFNSISISGSGNAITNISVDSTNTSKLNINKGTSFLTEHPSINRTTSSREEVPAYGTKFDVVESLTMDQNGHITGYNTKKVEMVKDVNHANTADIATTANNATKAEKDSNNNIISGYINNVTTNGSSVVFKKGDSTNINFVVPYAETSGSSQGEVTWDAVTNKPTVFPPSSHNHTTYDITNFANSVKNIKPINASTADYAIKADQDSDGNSIKSYVKEISETSNQDGIDVVKGDGTSETINFTNALHVPWNGIINPPSEFTPSAHNHTTSDITDFVANIKTIKVNNALKADQDSSGNNIKSYVKGISETNDQDGISVTKGDGTSETINFTNAHHVPWSGIVDPPSTFTPSSHNHTTADITNFIANVKIIKVNNATTADYALESNSVEWTNVQNKPTEFTPSYHTHRSSAIEDFDSSVKTVKVNNASTADSVEWTNVQNKPTTFTPSYHTHYSRDIQDFDSSVKTVKVNNASTADISKALTSGSSFGKVICNDSFVSSTDWKNVFMTTQFPDFLTTGHHGFFMIGTRDSSIATNYTYLGMYNITSSTSGIISTISRGSSITDVRLYYQGNPGMFALQIKTNSSTAPLMAYLVVSS